MDAKANGDRPASEMTKREMIAAMSLQGLLAKSTADYDWDGAAHDAAAAADALLAELAKEGS